MPSPDAEFSQPCPREPIDKPPAVDADAAPAALGYQAMEAVVLPPLQRNERSPLTLEKLLNAAHWAARRGNDPGNMRHLRQEINPYFTNAEIERALKKYCGGRLNQLADLVDSQSSIEWPQPLIDGAEGWPGKPKPSKQPVVWPKARPLAESIPAPMLPVTWKEIGEWYREPHTTLTQNIGEQAISQALGAKVPERSRYLGSFTHPELASKTTHDLRNRIVALDGIAPVDDYTHLESTLDASQPYLCIAGDTLIRNGDPDAGTLPLTKDEATLLSTLMLLELQSNQKVPFAELCSASGMPEGKAQRAFTTLIDKVNRPGAKNTIVYTGKGYRISSSTIIVDARPPETPAAPTEDQKTPTS